MQVEKVTRIVGNGVVVEFSIGSVYFPESFISGTKMNPDKYFDWPEVNLSLFGRMSGDYIKIIARQINERICKVGSLDRKTTYDYVIIIPRNGSGIDFIKITNAHFVKKGGEEHLRGLVKGKRYSVGAGTRMMDVKASSLKVSS